MKQFILVIMTVLLFAACNNPKPEEKAETTTSDTSLSRPQSAEFADTRYTQIGKSGLDNLSAGNVDAWMENFADDAVYQWNTGDSLAGKKAIMDYWKDRRANVIDMLTFSNVIWLPVKVNQPQSTEAPGTWLLGWYRVDAKYKTGKSMTQWMHMAQHFNANDKIDRIIHYMDKALVMEATKK